MLITSLKNILREELKEVMVLQTPFPPQVSYTVYHFFFFFSMEDEPFETIQINSTCNEAWPAVTFLVDIKMNANY